MTRAVVTCLIGIALAGSPGARRSVGPVRAADTLTIVLWLDATISTTEAMSTFIWDDVPREQRRGVFVGSKTPASLGDAFSAAVGHGFIDPDQFVSLH